MIKELFGATALSVLFLCSTAQAVDVWQGTKYAYSTSNQHEYAIKVELGQNQKGSIATSLGSSSVIYKKVGDNIEISPTGSISFVSYPFKVIEETGEGMQVELKSKLKKIVISGSNDLVEIKHSWEGCYEYPVDGNNAQKCETTDSTIDDGVVLKEEIQSVGITAEANDNIVLPIHGSDSIFINLKADKAVQVLKSGKAFDGQTVSSWNSDGRDLVLVLGDGATITYTATQNMDGISRVVGLYKNGPDERTIMGAFAIDEKIDVSSFSKSDVEGNYKTVLASSAAYVDTLYMFNSDGLGGFEYTYLGEFYETIWSWNLEDGLIKATRYRNQDGIPAMSKEEVQACMIAGSNCDIHQTRSYKIIGKTGNRYTMMRTLNHKSDDQEYSDLSVWVFYKQ